MRGKVILIVDDELLVAESIAEALERPDHRVIRCTDIDAAACVLDRFEVSLVLTDVRMSMPFGYEGLELVRRVSAMRGTAGVVVMTGLRDPELGDFVRNNGASMLLQKPFDLARVERFLEQCPSIDLPRSLEAAPPIVRFPILDHVIRDAALTSFFQPVIDLRSGTVAGAEALCRYPVAAPLNDVSLLFEYAGRRQRTAELDLELLSRSLAAGAPFAKCHPLFLNVHPATLGAPDRFIPNLVLRAEHAGVPLQSIVVEITEHAALPQNSAALESLDALRSAGVRFALDDVGSAYSHLSLIERIQPSFLKISSEFGTGFERRPAQGRIVRNILQLADDFGIEVIIEGVETVETAIAAKEAGIALAQGYYFARPAPISELMTLTLAAA